MNFLTFRPRNVMHRYTLRAWGALAFSEGQERQGGDKVEMFSILPL